MGVDGPEVDGPEVVEGGDGDVKVPQIARPSRNSMSMPNERGGEGEGEGGEGGGEGGELEDTSHSNLRAYLRRGSRSSVKSNRSAKSRSRRSSRSKKKGKKKGKKGKKKALPDLEIDGAVKVADEGEEGGEGGEGGRGGEGKKAGSGRHLATHAATPALLRKLHRRQGSRVAAKYKQQQDMVKSQPREVADEAVRKLFEALDTDNDEWITLNDLLAFNDKYQLLKKPQLQQMFMEARGSGSDASRIRFAHIQAAVSFRRQRSSNAAGKPVWGFTCRKFRDEWLVLIDYVIQLQGGTTVDVYAQKPTQVASFSPSAQYEGGSRRFFSAKARAAGAWNSAKPQRAATPQSSRSRPGTSSSSATAPAALTPKVKVTEKEAEGEIKRTELLFGGQRVEPDAEAAVGPRDDAMPSGVSLEDTRGRRLLSREGTINFKVLMAEQEAALSASSPLPFEGDDFVATGDWQWPSEPAASPIAAMPSPSPSPSPSPAPAHPQTAPAALNSASLAGFDASITTASAFDETTAGVPTVSFAAQDMFNKMVTHMTMESNETSARIEAVNRSLVAPPREKSHAATIAAARERRRKQAVGNAQPFHGYFGSPAELHKANFQHKVQTSVTLIDLRPVRRTVKGDTFLDPTMIHERDTKDDLPEAAIEGMPVANLVPNCSAAHADYAHAPDYRDVARHVVTQADADPTLRTRLLTAESAKGRKPRFHENDLESWKAPFKSLSRPSTAHAPLGVLGAGTGVDLAAASKRAAASSPLVTPGVAAVESLRATIASRGDMDTALTPRSCRPGSPMTLVSPMRSATFASFSGSMTMNSTMNMDGSMGMNGSMGMSQSQSRSTSPARTGTAGSRRFNFSTADQLNSSMVSDIQLVDEGHGHGAGAATAVAQQVELAADTAGKEGAAGHDKVVARTLSSKASQSRLTMEQRPFQGVYRGETPYELNAKSSVDRRGVIGDYKKHAEHQFRKDFEAEKGREAVMTQATRHLPSESFQGFSLLQRFHGPATATVDQFAMKKGTISALRESKSAAELPQRSTKRSALSKTAGHHGHHGHRHGHQHRGHHRSKKSGHKAVHRSKSGSALPPARGQKAAEDAEEAVELDFLGNPRRRRKGSVAAVVQGGQRERGQAASRGGSRRSSGQGQQGQQGQKQQQILSGRVSARARFK